MTTDLASWLTAIWDEDEAAAKAAFSNQEDPENGWGQDGRAVTPHVGVIHEDVQRAHVAKYHPGTVLARIAADRKILARLEQARKEKRWAMRDYQRWADGDPEKQRDWQLGATVAAAELAGLETAVRLLASAYADRPGYRDEWAV